MFSHGWFLRGWCFRDDGGFVSSGGEGPGSMRLVLRCADSGSRTPPGRYVGPRCPAAGCEEMCVGGVGSTGWVRGWIFVQADHDPAYFVHGHVAI